MNPADLLQNSGERATIAALEGDRDEAIRLLGLAMERGWVRRWYIARDPNMISIVDDRKGRRLLDQMGTRIAAMRQNLENDPGESVLVAASAPARQ